jgi:hypothetical protein
VPSPLSLWRPAHSSICVICRFFPQMFVFRVPHPATQGGLVLLHHIHQEVAALVQQQQRQLEELGVLQQHPIVELLK